MIAFILSGFISGFLLLAASSRLLKSFAMDMGFTPTTMIHIPHLPKSANKKKLKLLKSLWARFFCYSLFYGIIFATIFAVLFMSMEFTNAICLGVMLLAVTLAGLIDIKVWILPDFITIPLLISGFAVSYYFQPIVSVEYSIGGAIYAYILPLLAMQIVQKHHINPMGGGDVKMMAAMGAWLGFELFNVMLIVSFIAFMFFALIRKSNIAPYGPALSIAVITTVIAKVLLT